MSKTIYKIILIFGFIALAHSAYSAVQFRTYLRISEQEFTSLPLDISLQAIVSFAVIIYSILCLKSDWKLIHATDIGKTNFDTLSNLQSFYTFNHRGKALFNPHYQQPQLNMDLLNN
ncbi:hypothetical protein PVAND_004574 [Polypedilum vanderplanki]|uniref:Membrane magnesium transporter n=1 Tax=Polypedilum vanderplanki TaxID=319348 RepID=A0A9J6BXJ6_POLVA|nr:hypothetical protein PVAND_004574 [Polypedilum vanderplanki]